MRFLKQILNRSNIFGIYQPTAERYVHRFLLIYELVVVLILGAAFILVSPLMHGLIVAALFAGAFPHIRNYICGRIVQFDKGVQIGNRLKFSDHTGTIAGIQRVGLKLRTNKGLRFINYSNLLNSGYLLLAGEEIGGYYRLQIKPQAGNETKNNRRKLLDILHATPYLNWQQRPIIKMNADGEMLDARIVLREERQLGDLIQLLEEWGYSVKKKNG
ncbi:MAG: mechanosensitive ion channel domain-containing protein [Saprospiraceae bacterium]